MDLFYLTADVLPRLSLFVLSSVVAVYFAARARRTPSTAWLALAVAGFAVHHAAFVGYGVLASPAAQPFLNGLTWSSVLVAAWSLLGMAFGFLGAPYSRRARRALAATGVATVGIALFIHLGFGPLGSRVSSLALQVLGAAAVVALGVLTAGVLASRVRAYRTDPGASRPDAARSARKAFFVILSAGLMIPIAGVFRNAGVLSYQLDEQVALVMWAVVLLGLVTITVNYDLEPTSVLVKVVAFGFMAVVAALGIASVVAFPVLPAALDDPPAAVRFVPEGPGNRPGYRVAPEGPVRQLDGRPVPLSQRGQARVPLGIGFPFAGRTWREVLVDEGGLLVFGDVPPASFWDAMTGSDVPWIAPLLSGLSADARHVSVHRDSGRVTVTWREAPLARGGGTATFQVALGADGSIAFRYGSVPRRFGWAQGISPGGVPASRVALAPGLRVAAGAAPVVNRVADWQDAETRRVAPYAWLILALGLAVLVAFPLYLRGSLSRPLRQLVEGVQRAARGHLEGEVPVGARDEIGRLTEDFNQMTRSLRQAEASLRDYADTLEGRVAERTAELAASLESLKAAQARLVQQEKLASLGQLTAGIAHEIKNPLNFVTNFAGLSQELVDELAAETDPEEREALLADLRANAAKIEEHGRRADAIVRSMMAHARSGPGEPQPVALNALVEEYAALAHHGLRARQPDAHVALDLQLDGAVGTVELAAQEIGRVLINLLDNAFDAVRHLGDAAAVTVSTRRTAAGVEIRVADNGAGMAPEVAARVFEPFFTTKPTGEGTGLGLSLSYDIVTQGHGGELAVESAPGEGSTFTITLPHP